jgi:farnesyl-diphosphate farnesyltransferase
LAADITDGAEHCGAWRDEALAAMDATPPGDRSRAHQGEKSLLTRFDDCLAWLAELPEGEAAAVRRVLATIVSGQRLDVERFGAATRERPVALSEEELDDYTFRVAGCVGRFWTELGMLTLGERFTKAPREDLESQDAEFGKALQMVNILRDLPADLTAGRCYLPVADPHDRHALMAAHREWVGRTASAVKSGSAYSLMLRGLRLRTATLLPALIAEKTLDLLKEITWEQLEQRPKISRAEVRRQMFEAFKSAILLPEISGKN